MSARAPKYRNTKTVVDGVIFDSKREAHRYSQLRLMERAGVISKLERQVRFELAPSVRIEGETRARPAMRYFADFVYVDESGNRVVEDVKSAATAKLPAFRAKAHLMKTVHGIDVRIVK